VIILTSRDLFHLLVNLLLVSDFIEKIFCLLFFISSFLISGVFVFLKLKIVQIIMINIQIIIQEIKYLLVLIFVSFLSSLIVKYQNLFFISIYENILSK